MDNFLERRYCGKCAYYDEGVRECPNCYYHRQILEKLEEVILILKSIEIKSDL
jgi:hypothetical protein